MDAQIRVGRMISRSKEPTKGSPLSFDYRSGHPEQSRGVISGYSLSLALGWLAVSAWARSARLGPLCGSQRVRNSRNKPHSGLIGAGPQHQIPRASLHARHSTACKSERNTTSGSRSRRRCEWRFRNCVLCGAPTRQQRRGRVMRSAPRRPSRAAARSVRTCISLFSPVHHYVLG